MDVESLAKQLILKGMTQEQQTAVLESIKGTMLQARTMQKQRIGENVQVVVQSLKKIESDITARYDEAGRIIAKRVATIKDGRDGQNGANGKEGKPGRNGLNGAVGPKGADGVPGRHGVDGTNGISVTDAKIDFDGSLVLRLSDGREINVGEVAPESGKEARVYVGGGGSGSGGGGTASIIVSSTAPSTVGVTNAGTIQWFNLDDGLLYTWVDDGNSQQWVAVGAAGTQTAFETVSKNLASVDFTLAYNGSGQLSVLTYANGIVKTLGYNGGGDLVTVVLSGTTPAGIELTKTLGYTSSNLTSVTYT